MVYTHPNISHVISVINKFIGSPKKSLVDHEIDTMLS